MLKGEFNKNKEIYKNELENKDKEISDKLIRDKKDNTNNLYKYQKEIKELKEKIKIKKEQYKKYIEKKEKIIKIKMKKYQKDSKIK